MPKDIALTEDGDLAIDERSGGFAVVDGNANIEQQLGLVVTPHAHDLAFEGLTATKRESFRANLLDDLRQHPYVNEVRRLAIDFDMDAEQVNVTIHTTSDQYNISAP